MAGSPAYAGLPETGGHMRTGAAVLAIASVIFVGACGWGGGTPSGTVTFLDGATTLGTAELDPEGHATFQSRTLTEGAHTITAFALGPPAAFGRARRSRSERIRSGPFGSFAAAADFE